EAVGGLERLRTSALAYAEGRPIANAFPRTVARTPANPARGKPAVDPPGTWDTATWQFLHFEPVPEGIPHSYAFTFESALAETRSDFVGRAQGDLDGDGVLSTFEVRGHDDAKGPAAEPGMYVEAEIE